MKTFKAETGSQHVTPSRLLEHDFTCSLILEDEYKKNQPKHTHTHKGKSAKLEQPFKFLGNNHLRRRQANRAGVAAESKKTIRERGRRRESWQPALLAGADGNDALIGTECEASET